MDQTADTDWRVGDNQRLRVLSGFSYGDRIGDGVFINSWHRPLNRKEDRFSIKTRRCLGLVQSHHRRPTEPTPNRRKKERQKEKRKVVPLLSDWRDDGMEINEAKRTTTTRQKEKHSRGLRGETREQRNE